MARSLSAATPVVVLFGGLYAWAVGTADPTGTDLAVLALAFALAAIPWLVAARLVVDHWWARTGITMDGPARFLAGAVGAQPESRRRWGAAMLGELTQVRGRAARWRFALSCGRAVLFLPTARRPRPAVLAPTVLVIAAVAACVAAVATFLTAHPEAAEGLPPDRAAVLAVALAGCLWVATAPSGSRLAAHLGVGGAVLSGLVGLVISRIDVEGLPALWLLFGPVLVFGGPAFLAALLGRSFRAGVRAGVWTAAAVMPLSMALGLFGASREFAATGVLTFAGDTVPAGFSLGFVFLTFLAVPAIGFPFAVFGAAAGAAVTPRAAAR